LNIPSLWFACVSSTSLMFAGVHALHKWLLNDTLFTVSWSCQSCQFS